MTIIISIVVSAFVVILALFDWISDGILTTRISLVFAAALSKGEVIATALRRRGRGRGKRKLVFV